MIVSTSTALILPLIFISDTKIVPQMFHVQPLSSFQPFKMSISGKRPLFKCLWMNKPCQITALSLIRQACQIQTTFRCPTWVYLKKKKT